MAHGTWPISYCLWHMHYELWPMTYDPWPMNYELCPMTNDLRPMTYDLWHSTYNPWSITCYLWCMMAYCLWFMAYDPWPTNYDLCPMAYDNAADFWHFEMSSWRSILWDYKLLFGTSKAASHAPYTWHFRCVFPLRHGMQLIIGISKRAPGGLLYAAVVVQCTTRYLLYIIPG